MPMKEPCRNFLRGSCHYGERCKFLHVIPQQPKSDFLGFGTRSSPGFQQLNSQQQKPNPFGFGVQDNTRLKSATDFPSKQNHSKPFENKWTRFSASSNGTAVLSSSQEPDNQSKAVNHTCTDTESCKRQIVEDFEKERPLWKLTCYGHYRNSPCDIVGDISYEELRATAYDDVIRGLSLESIIKRERDLLNAKLVEFDNLCHKPYSNQSSSTLATSSPLLKGSPNMSSQSTQVSAVPTVSSFSQLGASLNMGLGARPFASLNNGFAQSNAFQVASQTSTGYGTNVSFSSSENAGLFGGSSMFGRVNPGDGIMKSECSPFSTPAVLLQNRTATTNQLSVPDDGSKISLNGVGLMTTGVNSTNSIQGEGDSTIWMKDRWKPGEIPEEPPGEAIIR